MTTGDGFLGLFGNPPFAHFGLQDLIGSPDLIKAGFAATFAIITVASSAVRSPTAPSSALGTVRSNLDHRGLLPAGLHDLGGRWLMSAGGVP